ncbi:cache domain-containing protein [Pseudomonas saliphila]|uniref:cache domain-containing protein n=1 Tax=Pseudomonas saliphila TaxID=2586906 RepID=UPI00123B835D|nr:cache domain-containing protein [Pseudomonas saliphila]
MNKCWMLLIGLCIVFGTSASADTQPDDARRAKALLERAVEHYREEGDRALAAFSRQGVFLEEDLYVFVVDGEGVMLASSGPSHALIGRNIKPLLDDRLKRDFETVLSESEEGIREGEYRWVNRSTGRVERKKAFYQRVGDHILAVGYYLGRPGEAEAKALLERVTEDLKENRHKTLNAINWLDPRYIQDELYAFVIDLQSNQFLAHGYDLNLIGKDFVSLKDRTGKPIGQDMLDLVDDQPEAQYAYQWRNPVTRKYETKQAYLHREDDLLIVVGHYSNLDSASASQPK